MEAVGSAVGVAELVANTVDTPRAVGGRGAVEPSTKPTVSETAVTVSAVQDSQIRK